MTAPATAFSITTARPTASSRRSTAGRRCSRSARSTCRSSSEQGGAAMCTSIVEIVGCSGAGKTGDGWIDLTPAVAPYHPPPHALLEEAIAIDFVNRALGPGARIAVELTLEAAKELSGALVRAIAAAEIEESHRRRGT